MLKKLLLTPQLKMGKFSFRAPLLNPLGLPGNMHNLQVGFGMEPSHIAQKIH
jgi:hypothetical protein